MHDDEGPAPEDVQAAAEAIRQRAMSYPEAIEDFPWGHSAFKVRKKTFLFMGTQADRLGLSFKLPASAAAALALPFTEPTGYGLGRSGWVSASLVTGTDVPLPLVFEWLDESYRAVAPKRLVKTLS